VTVDAGAWVHRAVIEGGEPGGGGVALLAGASTGDVDG